MAYKRFKADMSGLVGRHVDCAGGAMNIDAAWLDIAADLMAELRKQPERLHVVSVRQEQNGQLIRLRYALIPAETDGSWLGDEPDGEGSD